jgi:hypothetical protein
MKIVEGNAMSHRSSARSFSSSHFFPHFFFFIAFAVVFFALCVVVAVGLVCQVCLAGTRTIGLQLNNINR